MATQDQSALPGNASDNVEPETDTVPSEVEDDVHPDVQAFQRATASAYGIGSDGGGGGLAVGASSPLVVSRGGADDQTDTGQSGGRALL
ncbi:MAG: hypothetical protein ACLP9Y_18585 [Mycobacterium sp.]